MHRRTRKLGKEFVSRVEVVFVGSAIAECREKKGQEIEDGLAL